MSGVEVVGQLRYLIKYTLIVYIYFAAPVRRTAAAGAVQHLFGAGVWAYIKIVGQLALLTLPAGG